MMTQEDGFIEVSVNLYNRVPLIKWIRPVVIKKLRLLFDTYAMALVSRESGLDFTDIEGMDKEEYVIWMVWAAYMSHASLKNKRPKISIPEAQRWLKGMLLEDRQRVAETIQVSREIGTMAESYQTARNKGTDEEDGPKKAGGSELQN